MSTRIFYNIVETHNGKFRVVRLNRAVEGVHLGTMVGQIFRDKKIAARYALMLHEKNNKKRN